MSEIYKTSMTAKGGRDGAVYSADGEEVFDLSIPEAMGGRGGPGTNPEELFAAGYSSCFLGSLDLAARRKRIPMPTGATVAATVHLNSAGRGFAISVELDVTIPGMETETARMLVDAAHAICPYSRALEDGADVKIALAS